ncbi:hypothetical protein BJY52DRAFT_367771 [Lactarius psammicola]|nr:hypothetical protein BJY52DRAFT_367771 [Lactarius psammicola]
MGHAQKFSQGSRALDVDRIGKQVTIFTFLYTAQAPWINSNSSSLPIEPALLIIMKWATCLMRAEQANKLLYLPPLKPASAGTNFNSPSPHIEPRPSYRSWSQVCDQSKEVNDILTGFDTVLTESCFSFRGNTYPQDCTSHDVLRSFGIFSEGLTKPVSRSLKIPGWRAFCMVPTTARAYGTQRCSKYGLVYQWLGSACLTGHSERYKYDAMGP